MKIIHYIPCINRIAGVNFEHLLTKMFVSITAYTIALFS